MLLRISVLIAVSLCGSCMEMRETVERMVMVRTSGSDLQPAATGYIYKKKNDGEESVIKMGESEVMEQLSKYYKEPQLVDDKKSADIKDGPKDERVIPVSEESDEKIDGLHDDDFKKIFEKYDVNFNEHDGHDHYPHGLDDFDGHYYGYGGNKDNRNLYDNYKKQYADGGSGDYHNEKYSRYTHSHQGKKEKGSDEHDKHNNGDEVNKQEKTDVNNEGNIRFQKAYQSDQKDRKLYDNDDGVKFEFYKYGGSKYYGDDAGHEHDDSHESGGFGKVHEDIHGAKNSAEEQGDKKQEPYKSDGGKAHGNSYGFKISH